jgi:hypothetical protein
MQSILPADPDIFQHVIAHIEKSPIILLDPGPHPESLDGFKDGPDEPSADPLEKAQDIQPGYIHQRSVCCIHDILLSEKDV